jgi:hypothetical protein
MKHFGFLVVLLLVVITVNGSMLFSQGTSRTCVGVVSGSIVTWQVTEATLIAAFSSETGEVFEDVTIMKNGAGEWRLLAVTAYNATYDCKVSLDWGLDLVGDSLYVTNNIAAGTSKKCRWIKCNWCDSDCDDCSSSNCQVVGECECKWNTDTGSDFFSTALHYKQYTNGRIGSFY